MSRSRGYGMVLCGRGVEEGLRRLGGKEYGVMVVEEGVAWKFWSRRGDDAACEGGGGACGGVGAVGKVLCGGGWWKQGLK